MKLLFSYAALQFLLQGVAACAADYHLLVLANASHVPQHIRDGALFTVKHTQMLRARRHAQVAPAGGEGITPSLDDSEFDEEQNPQYAAELQREKEAFMSAQATAVPQPGSIEDNEAPAPTNFIDKRDIGPMLLRKIGLNKRQNPAGRAFIGVWNDNMDCNRTPPDTLARASGTSRAVDEDGNLVFQELEGIYDFYYNVFGRDSLDNDGAALWSYIHYCYRYSNAIWDGIALALGDGDGYAYTERGYVRSASIIAHEVTHGVIDRTYKLQYFGMSGALNEHLADVFAAMYIQYRNRQNVYQATWLIGEGIVVGGRALRDMANPGTAFNTPAAGPDRQPGNMANYYNGDEDDGGVHFNSGIPNRAFYLLCQSLGGNSWARAGKIWYNVLTGVQGSLDYSGETFRSFAQRTIDEAIRLYGYGVATDVSRAWQTVGVV